MKPRPDKHQSDDAPPKTSSRRFSKCMLVLNAALAWGAVYFSIFHQQAAAVTASALGLIGMLYAIYVGGGHMDFRKIVEMQIHQVFKGPRRD